MSVTVNNTDDRQTRRDMNRRSAQMAMPMHGAGRSHSFDGWTAVRVAHPVRDLARSTAFYRDLLGLRPRGGFEDHDGYDGVFFELPGGGELEFTTGPVEPGPGTDEDLLVLYTGTGDEVRAIGAQLVSAGVQTMESPNPYWNRYGQTFLDPDGYRIVIAQASPQDTQAEQHDRPPVEMHWHEGSREAIRPLFELAEDSKAQLDEYLDQGRVLLAIRGSTVVGHLQLVPTTRPGRIELKNMAVLPEEQGSGIGRSLVVAATLRCATDGWSEMVAGTAAADIGNLRFSQRVGFGMLSIDRDAFTAMPGYPDPVVIDGIALRDRVWLERDLHDARVVER